jgi:tripartite-type tricarboxylate transporter receptor subunit TctC
MTILGKFAFAIGATVLLTSLMPASVPAAEWPDRPVRIVAPFGAGGSSDRFGRLIAKHLSEAFGQQFYVENRPGAAGATGSLQAARSKPDGYTLLIAGTAPHITGPLTNPDIGYDPIRDFTHIAMIGGDSYLFAANAALGVRSMAELIARAHDGAVAISCGSPGTGTIGHLMVEQLRSKLGLKNLNHVPYRGGGPLATDLLGNHVSTAAIATVSAIEHVRVGSIVPLAVASDERLATLKDVPTLAELGHGDIGGSTWIWLAGPPQLSADIVGRINDEVRKFIGSAEMKRHFEREALLSKDFDSAQLTRFLDEERQRWRAAILAAGIRSK